MTDTEATLLMQALVGQALALTELTKVQAAEIARLKAEIAAAQAPNPKQQQYSGRIVKRGEHRYEWEVPADCGLARFFAKQPTAAMVFVAKDTGTPIALMASAPAMAELGKRIT